MDDSSVRKLLRSYFVLRDGLLHTGEGRGSVMMRELLLHVLAAHVNGTPLTLKRCYLTFPSATKIIRRDLQLLAADGFIEMERSPRDKRSVHIKPSAATLARLSELTERIDKGIPTLEQTSLSTKSHNRLITDTYFLGGGGVA